MHWVQLEHRAGFLPLKLQLQHARDSGEMTLLLQRKPLVSGKHQHSRQPGASSRFLWGEKPLTTPADSHAASDARAGIGEGSARAAREVKELLRRQRQVAGQDLGWETSWARREGRRRARVPRSQPRSPWTGAHLLGASLLGRDSARSSSLLWES